jgi:hypothetical protein
MSFIFKLYQFEIIASKNSYKKDNKFMNSKLPNRPKPAQIIDSVS